MMHSRPSRRLVQKGKGSRIGSHSDKGLVGKQCMDHSKDSGLKDTRYADSVLKMLASFFCSRFTRLRKNESELGLRAQGVGKTDEITMLRLWPNSHPTV